MTPTSPSQNQNKLSPLEDLGLIKIQGPDAAKFLQGQLTCDIKECHPQQAVLGAHCSPKGRVIANFLVLQTDDQTFYLRLPQVMTQRLRDSLSKYSVFSKVKLDIVSNEFDIWGLSSKQISPRLDQLADDKAEQNLQWIKWAAGYLIQLDETYYEYWRPKNQSSDEFSTIASSFSKDANNNWWCRQIRAGEAIVLPETTELFTPQELNLPFINAVSFRKGCYTGQEIVARMHYRGALKRHLYRLEHQSFPSSPAQALEVGQKLFDPAGKEAGTIVNYSVNADGKIELLAAAQDEQCNLLSLKAESEILRLLTLPYAIPTATST